MNRRGNIFIISKFAILLIFLNLLGCSNSNVERVKESIMALKSQRIRIPYTYMDWYDGRKFSKKEEYDTIKDFKLVIYKDSYECSSCTLKDIYYEDEFFDSVSAYNNICELIFIFATDKKDTEEVKKEIINSKFSYPIYIDTCDVFKKLNPHIPENPLTHIFLVDKCDSVILVGNFIKNQRLNTMLFKILNNN